jgi:ribosomal protein S18 acetylase RimI-like enzyme
LIVRRATPADAAALAELGARTFIDAFGAQNRAEDIDAYVKATYGVAQQLREIDDTLVVEDEGALIAFAQLYRSDSPHGDVELGRFYVDSAHHGRGIAQALMDAALAAARNLGGRKLWLGVWEHNPRGIRFYEKCGFVDVGSQPFRIGSDVQTDRVMTIML